jgi:PhnB protein
MQPITPYLTINGADKALEFYQKAFGATDIFRHPDQDGKRLFHARMTIKGGTVMMSDDYSKDHGGPSARRPSIPRQSQWLSRWNPPVKSTRCSSKPPRRAQTAPYRGRTCSGATASR